MFSRLADIKLERNKTPWLAGLILVLSWSGFGSTAWAQDEPGATAAETRAGDAGSKSGAEKQSALNTDPLANAIFDRPFVVGGQRASMGGYAETRVLYGVEEGISDGMSFNFQRFNLFAFAPIGSRIRFLSELEFEFEDGELEIKLETAQLDIEIAPEFVVRGGIILPPVGAFNQSHDGPIWDFGDRPLVSTTVIPSTFSEVGAGANGVIDLGVIELDYQLYLTQGLGDGVVDNNMGRTSIPDGRSPGLMEADNNGEPAVTARLALRYAESLEVGLSGWHGAYNSFKADGDEIDERRTVTLAALDFGFAHRWVELRGEVAWASVEVPASLGTSFGEEQWGLHVDAVVPVWRTVMFDLPTTLQVGMRGEYVDDHLGELRNGDPAGEEHARATASLALRPGEETVIRLNYGLDWVSDLVGNKPERGMLAQLGLATYF
ncbi:hypothetical protein [Bradymonas sediminis]|uniref:hypothetical protein n=1 Tax=Bradymonas sediminis TaxID=1548548 RepID=UPI00105D398F|nr:hypothetical protein [Bradymonas sediminis]TDP75967.1 hypothetical protein DFR33_103316 [Bradymonas sediminis]